MGYFFSDSELTDWTAAAPAGAVRHGGAWVQLTGRDIYVYGAGQRGVMIYGLLAHVPGVAERVRGFLDSDPERYGRSAAGLPVLTPESLREAAGKTAGESREEQLVIIAVDNPVWLREMESACHRLGLESVRHGVVTTLGRPRLPATEMNRHGPALAAARIWADEKSEQTYRTLVRMNSTWDFAEVHTVSTGVDEQYFQPFLPAGCHRAFVDGGAFTGDTLMEFVERFGNDFDNYYAFEPDGRNFAALQTRIAELDDLRDKERVHCWQKGLYDRAATLRFREQTDVGSAIDDAGETVIETVALDSVLGAGESVTFIKMDIEGAEPAALRGMKNIIQTQKPVGAVCVYHAPSHLWEIPLWLKEVNPGYRLYLRHHSLCEWESVCYAVPGGE